MYRVVYLLIPFILMGCTKSDFQKKSADVVFVNATQERMKFHFNSFYNDYVFGVEVADLANLNDTFVHKPEWFGLLSGASVGVKGGGQEDKKKVDLGKNDRIWSIAWKENGSVTKLTPFKSTTSNKPGLYRIRFLPTHQNIELDNDGTKVSLSRGLLTDFMDVTTCDSSLIITSTATPIDFCGKASVGSSYVMVLSNTRLLTIQMEQ